MAGSSSLSPLSDAVNGGAVVPLRRGERIPRQRKADQAVILAATILREAEVRPAPDGVRAIACAAVVAVTSRDLPRNNLRCLFSTLDSRRDFDFRLAKMREAQARAEARAVSHRAESLAIQRGEKPL